MTDQRTWQVLLLGGASGVGKSSISYQLARHYDVGITEIDDFQVILERMTTPDQQPVLHLWRTRPDAWHQMDEEGRLAHAVAHARVMANALEPVIANHVKSHAPIVLEGDFLLPALAAQSVHDGVLTTGHVRAIFLYEEDEDQIGRNYQAREGGPQTERARASWRYSEWLRQEATRLDVPTLPARPWKTLMARICAVLEEDVELG